MKKKNLFSFSDTSMFNWIIFTAYMIFIFFISSISVFPDSIQDISKLVSDFVIHIILYLIFGFLCFRAFFFSNLRSRLFFSVIMFSFIFAISDEIHQLFVPGRSFSMLDLLADFIGIITSQIIIKFSSKRM